jgi:hydrogenase maturation protein HypF
MERRAIEVSGIVQGVGFRPFVYNLATRYHLCGFVQNQSGRIIIEIEGDESALEHFLKELADNPPPLAQIDTLSWERQKPTGDGHFQIEAS